MNPRNPARSLVPVSPVLFALLGFVLAFAGRTTVAAPVTTGWRPLFKGIDYLAGTNRTSSGDFNSLMAAHILRVDLTDPDIRQRPLLPDPPAPP